MTPNYEALFKITYGLYVISSAYDQQKSGFISNTVMQVTAEPVQLALCASKENLTTELIRKSRRIGLSALTIDTPRELIGTFGYKSGRDVDKFANVQYMTTRDNIPILTDHVSAWFEGEVVVEQDMGTHMLFIFRLENSALINPDAEPMTYEYYRKIMKGKSPKTAPTYINTLQKKEEKMENKAIWICDVCGYEYDPAAGDPDSGVAPGTAFEDIPEDWVCPVCGVDKSNFSKK